MSFTKSIDPMKEIQEWFHSMCDGVWEHGDGIKIATLDNPGWSIEISLESTPLKTFMSDKKVMESSDSDWIHYWVEAKKFHARCGPQNLIEMLEIFIRQFIEKT